MSINPALSAFVASFASELIFGEVGIRRLEKGYELRHVADKECDPLSLQLMGETELRCLAQFTASGAFRPLKSAPTLQRSWRAVARDAESLGAMLSQLYPGAVADWFAAQTPPVPVTSYRDFTGRQTGMYRITTHLDDATAGAVIRACCHKYFCLKRRWWTVDGLAPDEAASKSIIACLEPCAILLEFARKMARVVQEEKTQAPPNRAVENVFQPPDGTIAECDFESPNNARRLRFVLERTAAKITTGLG